MSFIVGRHGGVRLGKKSERLLTQIGNPKVRQSYFGAVNAQTGELLLSEAEYANSETTIAFLEQLQGQYQGKKLWVIWDADPMSSHRQVCCFLSQKRTRKRISPADKRNITRKKLAADVAKLCS